MSRSLFCNRTGSGYIRRLIHRTCQTGPLCKFISIFKSWILVISTMRVDAPINPIPGTEVKICSSLDLLVRDSRILTSKILISLSKISITFRYDWRRTRHNWGIDAGNVVMIASGLARIFFGSELIISSNGLFRTSPLRFIDLNFPNKSVNTEDKRILVLSRRW
jgi:hypothetical protein